MQTTSEIASIVITELSRTSTPRPASTVRAPKTSGIAAATSERKTIRRTRRRSGTASSSARSVALIVSSCSARETEAKPDWVAVSGGWICSSTTLSRAGTVSRIAVASGTWKSTMISALSWPGRSAATVPRSQGEITVALRHVAQGPHQRRPLPFDLRLRAR